MPLQIEAFLPLIIIGGALYAGGPLLDYTHRFFNNGKVQPDCTLLSWPFPATAVHDGQFRQADGRARCPGYR